MRLDGSPGPEPSRPVVPPRLILAAALAILAFVSLASISHGVSGILPAPESAAAKKPTKKLPPMSYLARGGVQKVNKLWCGRKRTNRTWEAVKIVRPAKPNPWVISYRDVAGNLFRLSRSRKVRTDAKKKAKVYGEAKKANKRAIRFDRVCRTLPIRAVNLKGNLRGAVAAGIEENGSRLVAIRPAGGRNTGGDFEVARALVAEDSAGNQEDVAVREVVPGPGQLLYILLKQPAVVGGSGFDSSKDENCSIFVADKETGVVTCIDRELGVYGCQENYWAGVKNPCLQVDREGRLHYFGTTWRSLQNPGSGSSINLILRRYDPAIGERQDLIPRLPGSEFGIIDYLLLEDGGVLIAGISGVNYGNGCEQGNSWLKWLASDGSQHQTISRSCVSFLQRFPDGNIYFGTPSGVRRLNITNGSIGSDPRAALDVKAWIGPPNDDPDRAPYFSTASLCTDPNRWGETWTTGPCDPRRFDPEYVPGFSYGYVPFASALLRDGDRVFYSERPNYNLGGINLVKVFDSGAATRKVEHLSTGQKLASVQQAAASSGKLVLYGTSRSNKKIMVVQNPDGLDQQVVSDQVGEVEVFSLAPLGSGEVAFSGWSIDRNDEVLGVVDVNAGSARITRQIEGRMVVIIPLN